MSAPNLQSSLRIPHVSTPTPTACHRQRRRQPLPYPGQSSPALPALEHKTLQVEDVLNVIELERPEGIIVQFGGQTPLKLAGALDAALKKNPIPCASGEHPATAPTHAHQGRRCVLV